VERRGAALDVILALYTTSARQRAPHPDMQLKNVFGVLFYTQAGRSHWTPARDDWKNMSHEASERQRAMIGKLYHIQTCT